MRILTDEQVARMEMQLEEVTSSIHYCSATPAEGDYIYIGCAMVHRKELQNRPYIERGGEFEVLYNGKFRSANKHLFTIHN